MTWKDISRITCSRIPNKSPSYRTAHRSVSFLMICKASLTLFFSLKWSVETERILQEQHRACPPWWWYYKALDWTHTTLHFWVPAALQNPVRTTHFRSLTGSRSGIKVSRLLWRSLLDYLVCSASLVGALTNLCRSLTIPALSLSFSFSLYYIHIIISSYSPSASCIYLYCFTAKANFSLMINYRSVCFEPSSHKCL